MAAINSRVWSLALALALLVPLSVVSTDGRATESTYDNVERIDVSSYTAAGIAVSQRVFPDGADAAVLTRDDHFPDALAASALADEVGGPVLFTDSDSLTVATAEELDRLLDVGDTVYLTGGPVAISEDVEGQVRARGYEVTRLAGPTRVETAVEIGEFVGAPASGHVLIARAWGPPGSDRTAGWVDSVTCGAYANRTRTPVLLTRTESLDEATAAGLTELGATSVTICGGPDAVSDTVAQQLRDRGLAVDRAWGATRVETAVAVAQELFGYDRAEGRSFVLVNGYGDNFGWGLAATPLAGALGAPILLVGTEQPTSCTDASQPARATLCYLGSVDDGVAELTVIGGTTQVGDAVVDAAARTAGGRLPSAPQPLAVPSGVQAANVSTQDEGRVVVSWDAVDDPDGRLAGYDVYVGTGSPDTRAGSGSVTAGPDVTSYTVGALQLDTTYTFAVTSVTDDDLESAKSTAVSRTTSRPEVDLIDPTASGPPGPVGASPSDAVGVTFTYVASEGATYQIDYRLRGDDTWFSFPETPATSPGRADGGSDEVTRSVTAPSDDGTYDLRVRLFPTGADTVVIDVEAEALIVETPSSGTVTVVEPVDAQPVLQGERFEVSFEFSTDQAGTYRLFHRPSGDDAWVEFPETSEASPGEFGAGDSPVTATVTAPEAPGERDLRVALTPDGGDTVHDVAARAIEVQAPTVTVDAPTTAAPANVAPGQDVTVTFTSNVDGAYQIARRLADQDPEAAWTVFANTDGSATADEQEVVAVTIPEGEPDGTYDLQVALTRTDDSVLTGQQEAALTVSATSSSDDSVEMTAPTAGAPASVDHETGPSTFEIRFTYTTQAEGREYALEYSPEGAQSWQPLQDSSGSADATGAAAPASEQPMTVEVTAPAAESDATTYDLRVRLLDGETQTASWVEDRALTVAAATPAATPFVDITDPTAAAPATTTPSGTFTLDFSYGAIPDGGTYVVSWRVNGVDASQEHEWVAFEGDGQGSVAGSGTAEDLTLTAPPLQGTYDLRARIDGSGGVSERDVELGALVVEEADGGEAGSGTVTVSLHTGCHPLAGTYRDNWMEVTNSTGAVIPDVTFSVRVDVTSTLDALEPDTVTWAHGPRGATEDAEFTGVDLDVEEHAGAFDDTWAATYTARDPWPTGGVALPAGAGVVLDYQLEIGRKVDGVYEIVVQAHAADGSSLGIPASVVEEVGFNTCAQTS